MFNNHDKYRDYYVVLDTVSSNNHDKYRYYYVVLDTECSIIMINTDSYVVLDTECSIIMINTDSYMILDTECSTNHDKYRFLCGFRYRVFH